MFSFVEIQYLGYRFSHLIVPYRLIFLIVFLCSVSLFSIHLFRTSRKNLSNYVLLILVIIISFFTLEVAFRIAHVQKSNVSFITTGATLSRVETLGIEKSEDTFKILTLGDSFTAGAGVKDLEYAYPSQLKQLLNENSKNLTYEVYNLGLGGINTVQEHVLLKSIGLQYNPDLIILQYHPNDIGPISYTKLIENYYFLIPSDKEFVLINHELIPAIFPFSLETNKLLLKYSYFLRFTSKKSFIIHKKIIKEEGIEKWEGLNHDALKGIIEISKKENTPLIIIFVSGANPERCFSFGYVISKIRNLTMQNDVPFVDLCDYTKDYDSEEIRSKNDCDVCDHYNEKGYRIMAEAIFENIQELGFI